MKLVDKVPFKKTVFFLIFFNLLMVALVALAQQILPPVVPLFYGRAQGEEQLAKSLFLSLPAFISLLITLVNLAFIYLLDNRFLQKVLLGLAIGVTILSTITILKIILLVGAL
jgi:hypothetical protein